MYLISHRGNINGPSRDKENSPDYIEAALNAGFNVEVDVWGSSGGIFLGHDAPKYRVSSAFLEDHRIWCHAKNLTALVVMLHLDGINCFWHENDKYTLTKSGHIWTFPREQLSPLSIAVYPELYPDETDFSMCAGICSNHISDY